METTFDPTSVELRWRQRWEELGIGHADVSSTRPTYVIALPPPNITGALHMGHACGFSIQDTLVRQKRMAGYEVEWCPGTDHAAIATQNVIERQLADEGTSKEELGRAGFQARVDAWYEEYGGRIYEQMRRLGYTCDWARARFTLDPEYVRAIRVAFKALFDAGLIYRGPRIVNWCPRDRSAISDEEIDWREHRDTLYYLRYPVDGGGDIVVATVRPETMLGDSAVAVSPGDPRYDSLVGRTVTLPLTGRQVPIVADSAVKPEFGTGALKVTPGHDPTDYEIGRRHNLDIISVIAADGTMSVASLPQFDGLPAEDAREAVVQAIRAQGAVVRAEEYVHDVGHCDRCGHVLEPLVSEQWWVRMHELAQPGIAVVESGELTFHPRRYTDVYLTWMRNLRDWCISRQIWLGHAIPVSRCGNGHTFAWIEEPTSCAACGDTTLVNDPDVLDTWFSSALWPFAIFGWPDTTTELQRFYPTDVLVTGRDIIFAWVSRMIEMGLRFTSSKPFSQVMITSIIQAADGSRMSKSKGNVVDPLEMVDLYGADAVRAWAAAVGTGSQDVRFDAERIKAYQLFANKIWNVTRFLATRVGDGEVMRRPRTPDPSELQAEDRWMLAEIAQLLADVDESFTTYRFHEAMNRLYDVTWHSYCDWYVEMAKLRLRDGGDDAARNAAAWTALTALDVILRLLHPFMPFLTEECAQHLPDAAATLQQREWPSVDAWWRDEGAMRAHQELGWLIDLVARIRALQQARSTGGDRARVSVVVSGETQALPLDRAALLVADRVPAQLVEAHTNGATADVVSSGGLRALVVMTAPAGATDRAHERKRLAQLEQLIARSTAQLAQEGFVKQAPPDVVEGVRRRRADAEAEAATLRGSLEGGE